jgi:hypothetical protein
LCEWVATQEHDGTIDLDCASPPDTPNPVSWMKAIFGGSLTATLFHRHLKNGLPIEAEGTI